MSVLWNHWRPRSACVSLLLLGCLSASPPISARALSLEDAVAAALAQNPLVRGARAAADAEQGGVAAARGFPNPVFDLEAIPPTLGRGSELSVGLDQPLPLWGRRNATGAVAAAQRRRFELAADQVAYRVAQEARVRYRRALATAARSTLRRELWRRESEVAAVARARFSQGEVSELDLGQLTARSVERRLQFESARDETGAALLDLTLWMDRPDTTGLSLDPIAVAPAPTAAELDSVLTQRPDLAVLDTAVQSTQAELSLTRSERYPDPTAGVLYRRTEDVEATRNFVGVRVSWPLPLFDRRRAAVELAKARVDAARVVRDTGLLAARLELRSALARAEQARQSLASLAPATLDSTRQTQRIARMAYSAGQIDAAQLSTLAQTTLDLELISLDRMERWYDAIGAVEAIVGRTLAPSVAH